MRKKRTRKAPDHVAGPIEEAAARVYFERGSKESIEKARWQMVAVFSLVISTALAASLYYQLTHSEVHVFQAQKETNGSLRVSEVKPGRFKADEDTQMAFANTWVATLTEISPALWQRNVRTVQTKSAGVARDQIKAYLQKPENNPAQLVNRYTTYVREYERISVNKVADMTYLIRYELTSRPGPGVAESVQRYAITLTLTNIGHKTRDDVFNNPEGLGVLNFSISEEK